MRASARSHARMHKRHLTVALRKVMIYLDGKADVV